MIFLQSPPLFFTPKPASTPTPAAQPTPSNHGNQNPVRMIGADSATGEIVRGERRRRLNKAFLRYHDANNWPLLREALKAMGRADLIGNGRHHLIPTFQPLTDGGYTSARRKNSTAAGAVPAAAVPPARGRLPTQPTGSQPREQGGDRAAPPTPALRARGPGALPSTPIGAAAEQSDVCSGGQVSIRTQ